MRTKDYRPNTARSTLINVPYESLKNNSINLKLHISSVKIYIPRGCLSNLVFLYWSFLFIGRGTKKRLIILSLTRTNQAASWNAITFEIPWQLPVFFKIDADRNRSLSSNSIDSFSVAWRDSCTSALVKAFYRQSQRTFDRPKDYQATTNSYYLRRRSLSQ